jgi:hypothetical protein
MPISYREIGGAKQDRTADLLRARQALSQLSYGPKALSTSGTTPFKFFNKKMLSGLGKAKHEDVKLA